MPFNPKKSLRGKKPAPLKKKKASEKSASAKKAGCVVGVGSSAGGLEALRSLFGALQPTKNLSFVVVQHLSPTHRSRLVEIIGQSTNLIVKEAESGTIPKAGYVYITPPNRDIRLGNGRLQLEPPANEVGPKPSVDVFLRSLAEENGKNAVGIILSGTGSDGSLGIRAIRAAGGVTISQTENSAKYDGMPRSANHTGAVDLELPPEGIAAELARIDRLDRADSRKRSASDQEKGGPYLEILKELDRETGANFSNYKISTVKRRIERRMHATGSQTPRAYAHFLQRNSEEARNLLQDILISVTSFFRDKNSFQKIYLAIRERLQKEPPGSRVRCWVVGCATGEEAYSMAVLLSEAATATKFSGKIQIFATDLDERALAIARRGAYPESAFLDFPKKWKEKYFEPRKGALQVKSSLRDIVTFAKHNIVSDPPFLEIDILTCRNVLIYFDSQLQERIFRTFHYALNEGGCLFLGKSESVSLDSPYFKITDKTHKIFQRSARASSMPLPTARLEVRRDALLAQKAKSDEKQKTLFQSLVSALAPDSVMIDSELQVKHYYGNAGVYFRPSAGGATLDATKLVQREFSVELSTLLHRAQKPGGTIKGRVHDVQINGAPMQVQLGVCGLFEEGKRVYLVSFYVIPTVKAEPVTKEKGGKAGHDSRLAKLTEELYTLREHLQSVTEEQETSNEELQALNEELQSANEELQSANEELETTNEELQSTNEELTTLNEEINVKSAELLASNQQVMSIQNAIVYPLIILDKKKNLSSFNPAARHLFKLTDGEIGNLFWSDSPQFDFSRVLKLFDQAMRDGTDASEQIKMRDRSFEIQVQIIRGAKREVDGAVVSFVENSQIVIALDESRMNRERLSNILENTPAMVVMKDVTGVYLYANRRFYETTGKTKDDVVGSTDEEVFGVETGRLLRDRDFQVANLKEPIQTDEFLNLGTSGLFWAASRFPLLDNLGRVQSVCTVALDITERTEQERKLKLFQEAISSSHAYLAIFEESENLFRSFFTSRKLLEDYTGEEETENQTLSEFLETLRLEKPGTVKGVAERIISSPKYKVTLPVRRRDGAKSYIEIGGSVVTLGENTKRYLIVSIVDLTNRIENEQTISQQQEELTLFGRLSAVAEISAGIAHEINTPLNVITTKTDLLRKMIQRGKVEPPNLIKVADDVDRMAKNISSIVLGLKTFAGSEAENPERLPLDEIIRDSLKICEFRLQRFAVDVSMQLQEGPVWVNCFPVQISQILINLINNSIDALLDHRERWIRISLEKRGGQAVLRLVDSGAGISPDVAEKIMTPFFTTKKDQKGTGIGLSLSRTIAHRHGGELILDNSVKNTAFVLKLPLAEDSGEAAFHA